MAASGVAQNGASEPLVSLWEKSGEKLSRFVMETKNEVKKGRM